MICDKCKAEDPRVVQLGELYFVMASRWSKCRYYRGGARIGRRGQTCKTAPLPTQRMALDHWDAGIDVWDFAERMNSLNPSRAAVHKQAQEI